jgi:hypothetical protein
MIRRSWIFAWCVAGLWACTGPSGCACAGFEERPPLSYQGPKINSAGAARLSANGFTALNSNATTILEFFAPGGALQVPVPCSIESVAGLTQLVVADTGQISCTSETCGRMDGTCDADDFGQVVTINFTGLTFAPRGPDLLEARVTATVQTGRIPISSPNNSFLLCFSNQRAKFTVDLDTSRTPPSFTELALNIKLGIDTKWDQLLSLEVASIGNAQACSGSTQPPNCIDPNDMEILNEGCSALQIAQLTSVKALLINQLTDSLRDQITEALAEANCMPCGSLGECPTVGTATSTCDLDAGACRDTATNKCVPSLFGVEGRLQVGQALAAVGAPENAAIDLSIGAGGGATATDAGITVGLRGGAKELAVASCVAPVMRPVPPTLALPDFDLDAPAPYDVGLSVSGQLLSELLFRAQQSGALCLELGNETIAALESGTLATLLPSLNKLTEGKNVPLRLVVRPVNPPSAVVGEGTVDSNGEIVDPLLRLDWQGLELDAYALIEDRFVRLFTVSADLKLPLGVTLDGCSGVTPVVGNLTGAITNVQVKNNELLAEPLSVLQGLVPSLLTLAEPQLAGGLTTFTVPGFQDFQLKVVGARGVGQVSGTSTYHHVGLYAELLSSGTTCTPMMKRAVNQLAWSATKVDGKVRVEAPSGATYSWRVDHGLWSTWREVNSEGVLLVQHPRLVLGGKHVIELRTQDGRTQQLVVQ